LKINLAAFFNFLKSSCILTRKYADFTFYFLPVIIYLWSKS